MNGESNIEEILRRRIAQISEVVPGSIGDIMHYELVECDPEKGDYLMSCRTEEWMRNFAGTLHGGLCATVLDQAMGFVSYCMKAGEGTAPTVQLSVNYHRPLIPGTEVMVRVHVVSMTRSLMSLSAEAWEKDNPEKLCLSGTGLYFYKPAKPTESAH